MKLKAKELRTTPVSEEQKKSIKRNPIYIILDNVLDTYNIGAIFRLADAVAAEKVILCGQSETPPHTRIKKASNNCRGVQGYKIFSAIFFNYFSMILFDSDFETQNSFYRHSTQ